MFTVRLMQFLTDYRKPLHVLAAYRLPQALDLTAPYRLPSSKNEPRGCPALLIRDSGHLALAYRLPQAVAESHSA